MEYIGLVKWFDVEKGFGVITNPEIGDIFLHKNNLEINGETITQLEPIVFELSFDNRKQRNKAVNAKKAESFEHFFSSMKYLGTNDNVDIEVNVPRSGYYNVSQRKEVRKFSLLEVVFKKVFSGKEVQEALNRIVENLEGNLDASKQKDHLDFFIVNSGKVFNDVDTTEISSKLISEVAKHFSEEDLYDYWSSSNFDLSLLPHDKKEFFFLHSGTSKSEKIKILESVNFEEKIKFFRSFFEYNNTAATLQFLQEFVISSYHIPKEALGIWKKNDVKFRNHPEECKNLIHEVQQLTTADLDSSSLVVLFRSGLIPAFFFDINLGEKIVNYTDSELERILYYNAKPDYADNNANFLCVYFEDLEERNEYDYSRLPKLYDFAKEYAGSNFDFFDSIVYHKIKDKSQFLKLWEAGKARWFPEREILEFISNEVDFQQRINSWVWNNRISREVLTNIFITILSNTNALQNRIEFSKAFNLITWCANNNCTVQVKELNKSYLNIILWFLDKEEVFSYADLYDAFIYFKPEQQVRILRKLFWLKATNKFDFSIDDLSNLARFDLDLYSLNQVYNPEVEVDISTEILIQALRNFHQQNKFLIESELFKFALERIRNKETCKIKLGHYFESCQGRLIASYDWRTKGDIIKAGDFYRIIFDYNPILVESVRALPDRRWDPNEKEWLVPIVNKEAVHEFAKTHRFFIDEEGRNYANNTHLVEFKRDAVPSGIRYCEGIKAYKKHQDLKKDFWWCKGEPCFQNCETLHSPENWEEYTLLDFLEILNFNTDSTNSTGGIVVKGKYYEFMSLINRFNRLLEKLYCEECNHILFPVQSSNFAAYTVVRFKCENSNCSCKDKVVYLNHCLNGKCGCIIDSRESKKCSHGLYICSNCGSCCSHNMLERRLNNLELTGGYIHENLRQLVAYKAGHLERAEYFCHVCASAMVEEIHDVFSCSCGVEYDTRPYRLKRPHKGLPKFNSAGNNVNDDFSDEDLPF